MGDIVEPSVLGGLASRSERFSPFATQFLQQNFGPGQGLFGTQFDQINFGRRTFDIPNNTPAQTFGNVLGNVAGPAASGLGNLFGTVANQTVGAFGGEPPFASSSQGLLEPAPWRPGGGQRASYSLSRERGATFGLEGDLSKSQLADAGRYTAASLDEYRKTGDPNLRPNAMSIDMARTALPWQSWGYESAEQMMADLRYRKEIDPVTGREFWDRQDITSVGAGGTYAGGSSSIRRSRASRGTSSAGSYSGYNSNTGLMNWRIRIT